MADDEQLTFDFQEKRPERGYPILNWAGKRPFRSTVYYPAQLKETFGKPDVNGWMNKIFWGDNLQVMSHLLKDYRGEVDLIYIDPPFDSKADYKKKIEIRGVQAKSDSTSFEEKQYGDIWTNDEYLQFMYERLIIMRDLLSDNGSIYLHCDWHKSHYLRMILDELFGQQNFRNEIAWCYTGPAAAQRNYPRKHDSILFFSKNGNNVFHPTRIKHKSGVHNTGQLFSDTNIEENPELKQQLESLGKKLEDWWIDIWSCDRYRSEMLGYPTQKPEALLERIIKASSNPGDLVFDCFMGSGTTQAVALKLGRRFLGADINLGAMHTTTKRLLGIMEAGKAEDEAKQGKIEGIEEVPQVSYPGLEVYNVNHYDFFRNPLEARELLLKALGVQVFPEGQLWDGELDGWMVKVMPVDHIATKADLESLKSNLPYKAYEQKMSESPNQPVEKIKLVCMGHEPDLKDSLLKDLNKYKLEIEIVDILREHNDLQFKREAEAEIVKEGGKLVIRSFYPLNLMQKLSCDKTTVEDWRQLVDSVLIDWNYDGGDVIQPAMIDNPKEGELVQGIYDIPSDAGVIKVKITDLLSESLEVEVR